MQYINILYFIGILLYQSEFIKSLSFIYLSCCFLCLNFFRYKYRVEDLLLIILVLILSLVNKNIKLVLLILLVLFFKKKKMEDILRWVKHFTIIGGILFFLILVLGKLELIDPKYYNYSATVIRNGLGFRNPNMPALYFFILVSHYLYYKWEKISRLDYIFIICGNIFIYHYAMSRTGIIVGVFQLLSIFLLKNRLKIKIMRRYFSKLPYCFFILTLAISFFYNEKINSILSARPYYWKRSILENTGILNVLFGGFGKKINYPLDNGYLGIYYYYGIISLMIFLYLLSNGIKKIEEEYLERSSVMLLNYLIYALSEDILITISTGILMICIMSRGLKRRKNESDNN